MLGSFGSNATRATFRGGRLRVILAKVTPEGGPTVAASAFVDTNTWLPTPMATLLPLVLATATLPVPAKGDRMRQLLPPSLLCQRFWLPLAYKLPPALG